MYISRSKHQVPVVYLEAGSTPPAVKDREAPAVNPEPGEKDFKTLRCVSKSYES